MISIRLPYCVYQVKQQVMMMTGFPNMDVSDPADPAQGKFKVFRGGGWNYEALLVAWSGNRFMMAPDNGIHFVGFRVALVRLGE
jgi:hypothetical protein